MKNNNFDFINEKFNSINIETPKELDNKVFSKLENATPKRIKFTQKPIFKTTVSMVACLAIFVSAFGILSAKDNTKITEKNQSSINTLSTFESYKDLHKYIKDSAEKNYEILDYVFPFSQSKGDSYSTMDDSIIEESITSSAQTYIQECGVDEGDIIKTNGEYVYVFNDKANDIDISTPIINIIKVNNGKSEKVSTIKLDDQHIREEMYVYGDTLVAIETKSYYIFCYDEKDCNTKDTAKKVTTSIYVYDISNPKEPKEKSKFSQAGTYANSRLIDNKLYFVTNYNVNYNNIDDNYESYVPFTCKKGGENEYVSCQDISYQKDSKSDSYVVVSAYDVKDNKKLGSTKALIGCGTDIYCSKNNLYIYSQEWSDKVLTTISKISLDDDLSVDCHTRINGIVDSQYSFSEKDNHLCVFTTVDYDEQSVNHLFVLDENLKRIYKSDPFAKTESIKAVKYIGNYAYVITYEQTDPLFIIDLKDVTKPVFKGEVKISGFSEMLVDVGNNMLLGIGYSTHYGKEVGMEITDGVKLALFDVSNPASPKVLDEKEYKEMDSEAQRNPKALVVNQKTNEYAIPLMDDCGLNSGALVVTIENGKIVEKTKKLFDIDSYSTRITFVDDYYYIVDMNNPKLYSFKTK